MPIRAGRFLRSMHMELEFVQFSHILTRGARSLFKRRFSAVHKLPSETATHRPGLLLFATERKKQSSHYAQENKKAERNGVAPAPLSYMVDRAASTRFLARALLYTYAILNRYVAIAPRLYYLFSLLITSIICFFISLLISLFIYLVFSVFVTHWVFSVFRNRMGFQKPTGFFRFSWVISVSLPTRENHLASASGAVPPFCHSLC